MRTDRTLIRGWRALMVVLLIVVAALAAPSAQQPRDGATSAATGSAVLTGLVITDTPTPAPIRRAIVTVTGVGIGMARSTIAADDGRFTFRGLPAGQFTVTATRPAYVPSAYGAKRPGRQGTPVAIAAGQEASVTIRMPRGAVIAGVLRDERGQPAPGVQVIVMDARNAGNATQSSSAGITDDRGAYRIYGLLPGEYHVLAISRLGSSSEIVRRAEADTDALLGTLARRTGPGPVAADPSASQRAGTQPTFTSVNFAPTFFPGTALLASASKVAVGVGDERTGIDFSITAIAMATISGTVSTPPQGGGTVQLSIMSDGVRLPFVSSAAANPVLSTPPGADGRFEYTNVGPGRYTIMARAAPGQQTASGRGGAGGGGVINGAPMAATPDGGAEPLFASATVDVGGSGAAGVALSLQPGARLAGRVAFDASTAVPPADLTLISVTLSSPTGTMSMTSGATIVGNPFSSVRPASVRKDGTFEIAGIAPGRYLLRCTLPAAEAPAWWLRTAAAGTRDLIDAPIEVVVGEDITGAVITFTDRRTELAGVLETASGLAATDYFVVVLPADRALWRAGSRRVQLTRPSSTGAFSVRELPPGAYRVAALTDVEPGDLADPAFLEGIFAASLPVTITDSERTVQNIRLSGGHQH